MVVVVGMLEHIIAVMIDGVVMYGVMTMMVGEISVLDGISERRRRGKGRLERNRESQQDEQETTHGLNYNKTYPPSRQQRHKRVTRICISRTINSIKQPERSSGEFFSALCVVVPYLITQ